MTKPPTILVIALILCTTCGCVKKMAAPPPPPPPETILGEGVQDSLFKGDQAVLSDQDIARILGTQVTMSDRHRLAILSLGVFNPWSEDIAETEAKNFGRLSEVLRTSPQLTEIRLLPSLLVPEKRTVPYLREAAARIQADLLLVHSSRIQVFRRDRFLKPDEVHAQCVAEAVLLDVRTGIAVHTGRAVENISMKKGQTDINFEETVARAQADARGRAVLSLANDVVLYLGEHGKP